MKSDHDLQWLHFVRGKELEAALAYFPVDSSARVLEIGSGTGYMLGRIRENYPEAIGLEVEKSAYEFSDPNITFYDGSAIPFPDNEFDVIFSSHVLEHVREIDEFITEIARVLKPGGIAIHIIPSPTWRVLTTLMHYLALGRIVLSLLRPKSYLPIKKQTNGRSKTDLLRFLLYAPRHGEYGNVVSEIYYFSQHRWSRLFSGSSLELVKCRGIGLVYWGRDFFRLGLPHRARVALAWFIGSASNLYVLRK